MKIKLLHEKRKNWWNWSVQPILILCITGFLLMSIPVCAVSKENSPENEKISLTEALYRISVQYQVFFSYDQEAVQDVVVFYEPDRYENVEHALGRMLIGTSLHYRMFNNRYIILYESNPEAINSLKDMVQHLESVIDKEEKAPRPSSAPPLTALPARTKSFSVAPIVFSVSGTVADQDGEPLIGVNIQVKDSSKGTATDFDGHFTLEDIDENAILVISYVGYQTQEVPVAGKSNLEIVMVSDAELLDEVVVVGYGTQKKVNLTGSVASASVKDMAAIPVPTVMHALQGIAPGIQMIDGGGRPGQNELNLLIRGQGTLGRDDPGSATASRPLILIDGIEGELASVDINSVESISVLKDASSAAIYGSRAANGVILVTTKRGTSGGIQVSYNGYYGMQDITSWPKRVDTETHMKLANIGRQNLLDWCLEGNDPNQSPSDCLNNPSYAPRYTDEYIQNTISGVDPDLYPDNEWVDAIYSPAPIQDHTIRIAGGSEAARYALTLNYNKENGMMANSGADRYRAMLNTSYQISEKISGEMDVSTSRSWNINPAEEWASTFYIVHDTPPTHRTRYSDGTYGLNLFGRSPLASAEVSGDKQEILWGSTLTGRLNYDIFPGWAKLQGVGSFRYGSLDWELFRTDPDLIDEYPSGGFYWGPSYGENRTNKELESTLRLLLDFGHTFRSIHNFSGVLGYEQIKNKSDEFRAWRDQFYNNELRKLDLGNSSNANNSGFGSEWALRSLFGRVNYTLKERYLLELNARYDGSSRFGEEHRYGLFPSLSIGWRISEEPFFNFKNIDELKLRSSWGQLGNQTVPLYSYYSSINLNIPYFLGNSGGLQSVGGAATSLVNEDLTWETTTVADIGIDILFLNGRLNIVGDIYKRLTKDILLRVPVPRLVGLESPYRNAGIVENKGWELEMGWRDEIKNFNYGVKFNLSDNRNKIVDLVGTGPYFLGGDLDGHIIQEGKPINSWYGLEALGLINSSTEAETHAEVPGFENRLGDIVFRDQNNDGVINDEDRVIIGNPNPRYIFGANINLGWKNVDLTLFFQGVGKRDQYLGLGFAQGPVWENYTSEWHRDYWSPDNLNARHPAYYSNENRNYYSMNSWWILDGSFVKLRNAQIGYTFPDRIIHRIGMSSLRIYATGKNLWAHHNLGGIDLDPEYPVTTGTYYPQTRVISVGVNVIF